MSVFGALNRFISRLDAAPIDEQQSGVQGAYGFQILKNTNQEVPLEPWFDFIIGINGRTIVSVFERARERKLGSRGLVADAGHRTIQIQPCSQLKCGTVLARRSV
jgi:hypothetical protein